MTGRGFARRVTPANLNEFAPLLKRRPIVDPSSGDQSEEDLDEANTAPEVDPDRARAEGLFRGTRLRVANPFHRARSVGRGAERGSVGRRPTQTTQPPSAAVPQPAGSAASIPGGLSANSARGPLVWQKTGLPASDVQRQVGNVTGGVRLTQAHFRDATNTIIDQTTYFRNTVFGGMTWRVGRQRPRRDDTSVPMHVILLGQSYGTRIMMVSNKPSGEAGQANYTAMLHWGDLGDTVRSLDLRGRTLRLYAPPSGQTSPFTLEVV